eukprot:EC720685.1.p2 GENE.EC720685.1~~EC720685.1.p2  ORF type:complete len:72 (+),score=6.79 EC720685.1:273-488(+)
MVGGLKPVLFLALFDHRTSHFRKCFLSMGCLIAMNPPFLILVKRGTHAKSGLLPKQVILSRLRNLFRWRRE